MKFRALTKKSMPVVFSFGQYILSGKAQGKISYINGQGSVKIVMKDNLLFSLPGSGVPSHKISCHRLNLYQLPLAKNCSKGRIKTVVRRICNGSLGGRKITEDSSTLQRKWRLGICQLVQNPGAFIMPGGGGSDVIKLQSQIVERLWLPTNRFQPTSPDVDW